MGTISYRFSCFTCDKIFDATDAPEGEHWANEHAAKNPTHNVDLSGEVYPFPPVFRETP